MTTKITLSAQKRDTSEETPKILRANNFVPAVFYGNNIEPTPIKIEASELLRVYRLVGQNNMFTLNVDNKEYNVLVKEVSLNAARQEIQHIDFFVVDMKRKLKVVIPINFVGVSPAVKNGGGLLSKSHNSILVQCLPGDIVPSFDVDLSLLKEVRDTACVADLGIDESKFSFVNLTSQTIICTILGRKALAAKNIAEDVDSVEETDEETSTEDSAENSEESAAENSEDKQ